MSNNVDFHKSVHRIFNFCILREISDNSVWEDLEAYIHLYECIAINIIIYDFLGT